MKQMTKADEGAMYTTKILFLIVLAVLIAFLLMSKNQKTPETMPAAPQTYNQGSDLSSAQDQLDAVNVDSVDNGLMQLTTEVAAY